MLAAEIAETTEVAEDRSVAATVSIAVMPLFTVVASEMTLAILLLFATMIEPHPQVWYSMG